MKINIGHKGYVTDEVSTVDIKDFNSNLENRIKSVTDIAAISRGKLGSTTPNLRFKYLLKEAAYNYSVHVLNECSHDVLPEVDERLVNTAGRPLEFCPVVLRISKSKGYTFFTRPQLNMTNINIANICDPTDLTYTLLSLDGEVIIEEIEDIDLFPLLRFSYADNYTIYTNYRAVYNFLLDYFKKYGISENPEDSIPFLTYENEANKYRVLRVKAPMFVWAQFMTHTQLSKISQSDRVSEQEDYWLPEDIFDRILNYNLSDIDNKSIPTREDMNILEIKNNLINFNNTIADKDERYEAQYDYLSKIFLYVLVQNEIRDLLKKLGYKREIYSRAPYYFKYKEFVIGGWMNDPHTWGHLLLERDGYSEIRKSWTQKETKEFSIAIREILENQN